MEQTIWEKDVAPFEDAVNRGDAIVNVWTIQDVLSIERLAEYNLTERDAWEILQNASNNFEDKLSNPALLEYLLDAAEEYINVMAGYKQDSVWSHINGNGGRFTEKFRR